MNEIITLPVFEIVGSSLCVASDDGEKVYERIRKAVKQERSVALSFINITSLTSAFLNAAIGQLYGEFSEEEIRAKLTVKDMEPDDLVLLKRVVETAKAYFKNPKLHNKATAEFLGGVNGQRRLPCDQDIAAAGRRILNLCGRAEIGFDTLDMNSLLNDFETGKIDFNDQVLEDLCARRGFYLVTDDADVKTVNLPLFTANPKLLNP